MEEQITKNEGVVAPASSEALKQIVNDIEAGKLREGYRVETIQATSFMFGDLNDALAAYKADKLPVLGMGKDRGYELSGTLGVAGLLGLVAGGIFLAKGKTGLGAVGLGAGAGLEVGAYATLPKKVPIVLYYYAVRDDQYDHVTVTRYVVVKLPKKLSDTAFEARSKAQIRQRIGEGAFVVPAPIEVERAAAREEHEKEVQSNGNPQMPVPDVSSSSGFEAEAESEGEIKDPDPEPPVSSPPADPPAPSSPEAVKGKAAPSSPPASSSSEAPKGKAAPLNPMAAVISPMSTKEISKASKLGLVTLTS